MNQELKQRLIGAVVVTSLAAIFIPMIFDDPVDNSAQIVSELTIPEPPVNTGQESANKLPRNAGQVLNKRDTDSETIINTEEEMELTDNTSQVFDEPVDDGPVMEPEETASTAREANPVTSSNSNIKKTIKTVNKTENNVPKQITPVQPLAIENTHKPINTGSDLKRWYLQAGTFSKKENALSLMETLHKLGLPAILESVNGAANTSLYRIKVGPTLDKKRGTEMKAKLDAQKIPSFLTAE